MIEISNLTYDYPGKRALDNISLSIPQNSITALVGSNGAGKTTLLRCIAALTTPLSGRITVDGYSSEDEPRKIHGITSYLSDFFGLYDELSVNQSLLYIGMANGSDANTIEKSIHETAKRFDLFKKLHDTVGTLSRGQRQRLAIAQTVIKPPKILILDEPASGLDPVARKNLSEVFVQLAKEEKMTLIVSSHILSELEDYSTDMVILQDGKIAGQNSLQALDNDADGLTTLAISLTNEAEPYLERIQELGLDIVSHLDNKVIIKTSSDHSERHDLMKRLITNDIPVSGLEEVKQRMQDIYLDIAKK